MTLSAKRAVGALFLLGLLVLGFLPASEVARAGAAAAPIDAADTAWMLTATALVLLMTPGLSFFYGGMVRAKNVVSTLLQSFVAMAVISLLWVIVGFSLAFGDSLGGVIGDPRTFFMFAHVGGATDPALAPTIPLILFALFQLKFAIITPALITGAFAERIRFGAYVLFMVLFSLLIYAPLAHWTWHPEGFLRKWGVLDFAGGTVVHMSAGFAAVAGAIALGRRRVHVDGGTHAPANIPFVMLGTGMLWFGWFGFNAGSALGAGHKAAVVFVTTLLAGAAGTLGWLVLERFRDGKATSLGAASGMVAGLVAITPSGGSLTPIGALLMGGVAGVVCAAAVGLKFRFGYDDSLDVVGVHLVGGLIGTLGIGLLGTSAAPTAVDGLFYGGGVTQLGKQAIGAAVVLVYAFVVSAALGYAVERLIGFRLIPEHEVSGIDLAVHGETAYDFHTVTGGRAGGHGILRSLSHPEED